MSSLKKILKPTENKAIHLTSKSKESRPLLNQARVEANLHAFIGPIVKIGTLDGQCFVLDSLLEGTTTAKNTYKHLKKRIPALYPTNSSVEPIRVLLINYDEITRTRYAIVIADTKTFKNAVIYKHPKIEVRDYTGPFFFVCKLEPDSHYNWINWVTIDHRRYPLTDNYIRYTYKSVYYSEDIPLRSVFANKYDSNFSLESDEMDDSYLGITPDDTYDLDTLESMADPDFSMEEAFPFVDFSLDTAEPDTAEFETFDDIEDDTEEAEEYPFEQNVDIIIDRVLAKDVDTSLSLGSETEDTSKEDALDEDFIRQELSNIADQQRAASQSKPTDNSKFIKEIEAFEADMSADLNRFFNYFKEHCTDDTDE